MPGDPSSYILSVQLAGSGFQSIWDFFPLLIVILLLMSSALISGAEAAFFSLSPSDKESLSADESPQSQTALELLQKPRELLATILILNNFVNVGVVILSNYLLGKIQFLEHMHDTLRFLLEVVLITLVLLLLGEVVPKIYSTKNALPFARMMALPLARMNALPPISWIRQLMVSGTNLLNRRIRKKGMNISSGELEQALALTREENSSNDEHKILEGIVKFGNTEVRQIMRARVDVYAIDKKSSFNELMQLILESGHSRIPVYDGSFDKVVGVLFIKDLLPHIQNEKKEFNWTTLIRAPFYVTENRKIDDLLKDFQEKKVHLAMVVDEYGGINGIVTLEDVLEEIVGEITDEFDDEGIVYTKINDRTYLFEGKTQLVDFFKVLEMDSKEIEFDDRSAETLGGLIVEIAGRIPRNNEFIELGEFKMIVESSDKRRIKMVKVVRQENNKHED